MVLIERRKSLLCDQQLLDLFSSLSLSIAMVHVSKPVLIGTISAIAAAVLLFAISSRSGSKKVRRSTCACMAMA